MVENLPANAGDTGSSPGPGNKIPAKKQKSLAKGKLGREKPCFKCRNVEQVSVEGSKPRSDIAAAAGVLKSCFTPAPKTPTSTVNRDSGSKRAES